MADDMYTDNLVPLQRIPSDPASTRGLVVVAVDGSEASVRALVWALRYAAERDLRVEALSCWPLDGPVFVHEVGGRWCEPRWRARETQAATVARALATVDDAPSCSLHLVNAPVVDGLVRARARAVVIVVGSDGELAGRRSKRRLSEKVEDAVPGPVVVVGPDGPTSTVPSLPHAAGPSVSSTADGATLWLRAKRLSGS
jgi:hypothetical protein